MLTGFDGARGAKKSSTAGAVPVRSRSISAQSVPQ
jgi:hypothetical protein